MILQHSWVIGLVLTKSIQALYKGESPHEDNPNGSKTTLLSSLPALQAGEEVS